jgi:hypothetical protein
MGGDLAMMTDIWCFTCPHEIRELFPHGYEHIDSYDAENCVCTERELECQP